MTDANDPQSPEDSPSTTPPGDEEAARLLEVGLSDTGGSSRTPPPAPETIAAQFPAFEILEVLGQGGMGVVYKARQRKLDRLVALKVLPRELAPDPAFAERFAREARTLARLQHPHIVGVHEFGESDGLFFLVMEYVDGVTLRQLMTAGELNAREALAIVPQICDALQYAHNEGVVHRDIKPENILLDKGGRVKVADFGLAKMTQRGPGDFTLTGTDQVMGTVHYMAPEQYKTPQDVDHRADIFSLGVVFYEMLTGELPMGKFAKLSEVPELDARIDDIVMRALERERDLRYQKADALRTDVRTVVRGGGSEPEPAFVARPSRRRSAKPRVSRLAIWALCALPVGALVAGIVYVLVDMGEGPGLVGGYHAAKAGLWTGFGFAGLAVVLGLWALARANTRARGLSLTLAVGAAVLGAISMISTAVGVAEEKRDYHRMLDWARERSRMRPSHLPFTQVEGIPGATQQAEIRKGVHDTWQRYLRVVSVRDLDIEHASNAKLYDEFDLMALEDLEKAEFDRKRVANELGMGFVGSTSVETPPAYFDLKKIQVDKWQRNATVTAQVRQPLRQGTSFHWPSMMFFMKRTDGGAWVFVVDKVNIQEYR